MNMMELDGYRARIEYDADIDNFRGEILGLNGGADFCGKDPEELRREFRLSLDTYLEVCAEKGIDPKREYSGKFNLRIDPELHRSAALKASSEGMSINQLVAESLAQSLK